MLIFEAFTIKGWVVFILTSVQQLHEGLVKHMLIVDFYPPLVSNEESCNPVEPDRDEAIGV